MNLKRPWIVAGATVAVAGFGAVTALASDDVQLNDRRQAPIVQMSDGAGSAATMLAADTSPESADSPGESPFDSADSAADSPDDAGFRVPAPAAAPTPRYSVDSGNSPAPQRIEYSAGSPDSADSP